MSAPRMKVAACYSFREVLLEEMPRPAVGPGDLLVQVHACGLCGSDISKLGAERGPRLVLGHEMAGVVVDAGRDVADFQVGQRVVAGHHAPCFNCHYCRHGSYSMCTTFKSSSLDPGGFAEYVRIPAWNVAHVTRELPEELSFEEASFAEPLACCLRAVRRSPVLPGDTALVLGLGSIGLLLVQVFHAFQMRSVGADLLLERQQLALALGAQVAGSPADAAFLDALRRHTEGRGPDLVVTATDSPLALRQAVELVRDGGTVNVFGGTARPQMELDLAGIYRREITLMSNYSSSPQEFAPALELLRTRQVRVRELITHRFPLGGLGQAIDGMRKHAGIKNMILPQADASTVPAP